MLGFVQTFPIRVTRCKRDISFCSNTVKHREWKPRQSRFCQQPIQRVDLLTMSSSDSSDGWKQQIQESIKKAEEATKKFGRDSKEAAAAWDAVEELDAEASHQRVRQKTDPLETFCDESPEAEECRVYDN
ncbi:small chloroplast protein [Galdieria sulphuraria]|uniref:Small chloroplast protein n=1 Tax=Galdieria sulphuraria TaxID=130081 RepID=Q2PC90_GALSU|nr:small chloroplast protein [Galdieria sulphuraria]EME30187.1 small chloroplast protein [Galdieria sulphuraria]CAI34857.1 small chloroplast protein [Galdieria sulphuraria]CAI34858.1 small chloroplast protein [Galdieria sulphuraria]|eukprot:XP_005706707.1 small chloroplast protein [Galdieria sulphuraria]